MLFQKLKLLLGFTCIQGFDTELVSFSCPEFTGFLKCNLNIMFLSREHFLFTSKSRGRFETAAINVHKKINSPVFALFLTYTTYAYFSKGNKTNRDRLRHIHTHTHTHTYI